MKYKLTQEVIENDSLVTFMMPVPMEEEETTKFSSVLISEFQYL